MYDVVVIGAGVVGGLVARELSKYKINVCILEKEGDVAMGATKANSAIVHAGFDAKEGIMCGISSGTNVAAAIRLAEKLGEGKTVVTVLPDTAEGYFSTPLFD